jgi:hypothetical protein
MVVCASCAPAPSGCELPAARRHLLKVFLVAVVTFNCTSQAPRHREMEDA